MMKLNEAFKSPSAFDSISNYAGSIPDPKWLVLLARNRDSDILTESNWECALKQLGGESDDCQVFRFGHWACGWIEYLCVRAGSSLEAQGNEIEDSLEDYPVLDEDHYSEAESEEANRVWTECYDKKERLKYVRKFRNQFEFHDFKDLMSVIRGEYFNGYASELIC